MQLHEQNEDVVGISLNLDFNDDEGEPPAEMRQEVLAKLKELKATSVNLMSTTGTDDLLEKLDIISLPAVMIYDREGKLHKRLDAQLTYEKDVLPVVQQLLKKAKK